MLDRATAARGVGDRGRDADAKATIADRLGSRHHGDVAHVDPAVGDHVRVGRGRRLGHVKGHVSIADLGADVTAESIGFAGDVTLGPSRVAGRDITSASMTLALAESVLGVRRLEAATPLGAVTASGPLALNATATSDLAYTIRGIPLAQFHQQIVRRHCPRRRRGGACSGRARARTKAPPSSVTSGRCAAQGCPATAPFAVDLQTGTSDGSASPCIRAQVGAPPW